MSKSDKEEKSNPRTLLASLLTRKLVERISVVKFAAQHACSNETSRFQQFRWERAIADLMSIDTQASQQIVNGIVDNVVYSNKKSSSLVAFYDQIQHVVYQPNAAMTKLEGFDAEHYVESLSLQQMLIYRQLREGHLSNHIASETDRLLRGIPAYLQQSPIPTGQWSSTENNLIKGVSSSSSSSSVFASPVPFFHIPTPASLLPLPSSSSNSVSLNSSPLPSVTLGEKTPSTPGN